MLTIALEKVDFLPATRVTDDTSILTLKNLVFEPLLRWVTGGSTQPALFSHWIHSADGQRWEFFIRPGATFHDGKSCAPEDITGFIADILNAVDTFGMKWSYARYLAHARITIGSESSVIIENPEPIADILDIFSEFYLCRSAPDGRATLGTGPYRVVAFEPGRTAVLERVGATTGPERIVARAEPDADRRFDLLKARQVDAASNLERVHGRLDFDSTYAWGSALNTLSVMCYLNCFEGLFASPEARLAVNHAVDQDRLVAEVFQGLGAPSATIVSPFHLGMSKAALKPIGYDPDGARRLLDKAGGPDTVMLRTPTFMPERAQEISRFVAACLRDVGLKVEIEVEHDRPEYARQVGRKQIGDMAIFDSSPQSTYRVLNDKISSTTKAVWWQGYDDPEAERLISEANRAIDHDARDIAYAQCLRRLRDNPPWLYIMHPTDVFAAQHGAPGLSIDHKGALIIT
jgi:peptide/nickel transport system substrate-binding protein